jgi:hypothetical protein
MSIIEQAAKRLEELRRGGVDVPWAAAGLPEARLDAILGKTVQVPSQSSTGRPADPQQRHIVASFPSVAV